MMLGLIYCPLNFARSLMNLFWQKKYYYNDLKRFTKIWTRKKVDQKKDLKYIRMIWTEKYIRIWENEFYKIVDGKTIYIYI